MLVTALEISLLPSHRFATRRTLFNINQYPVKLLEGFMTDTRAIIVVKKGELNKFKIVKDQYASPQNVFHISGKTSVDIIASLEKHAPQMIQ
jgi:hypothetical protein